MKRIALVATAVAMLIAATVAFAATRRSTPTKRRSASAPAVPGTAKKPVKTRSRRSSWSRPGPAGNRAGVLLNINDTVYGLKVNVKGFPTCTVGTITAAGTDTRLPEGRAGRQGLDQGGPGARRRLHHGRGQSVRATRPGRLERGAGQARLLLRPDPQRPHACLGGAIKTGRFRRIRGRTSSRARTSWSTCRSRRRSTTPSQGLVGSLESETLNWRRAPGHHRSVGRARATSARTRTRSRRRCRARPSADREAVGLGSLQGEQVTT